MMSSLALRIARPLSIRRSLHKLAAIPTHVLVISPTTIGAISFARALGTARPCLITRGPIIGGGPRPFDDRLRSTTEIPQAFTGQPTLPRSVISFPIRFRASPRLV